MGYTIRIGEARFQKYEEDAYIEIGAMKEKRDDAPAFGEPTDYTNERWPSYSVWAEFLRDVGLYELFTNKDDGLMRAHPGHALLTKRHQEVIKTALDQRLALGKKPGFNEEFFGVIIPGMEDADPNLARLIWLNYWVSWAIEHCVNPVIVNT